MPEPQDTQSMKSTAYREGVAAFERGDPEDSCPYSIGTEGQRVAWYNGYFDQRTGKRLAEAFKHYGVKWP